MPYCHQHVANSQPNTNQQTPGHGTTAAPVSATFAPYSPVVVMHQQRHTRRVSIGATLSAVGHIHLRWVGGRVEG